jgi:citrate lyase synthetase
MTLLRALETPIEELAASEIIAGWYGDMHVLVGRNSNCSATRGIFGRPFRVIAVNNGHMQGGGSRNGIAGKLVEHQNWL